MKNQHNLVLEEATKRVVKTIDKHFKKDGWDLDFSHLVEEVFYEAYGEYLSDILFEQIKNKKQYHLIVSNKDMKLMLSKKNKQNITKCDINKKKR